MKGDFIVFIYNGAHSSDMGIVRVSDGSRYNEDLLPTYQDKSLAIPGGDGAYFFGSNYTQKVIPIQIAFDHLTELQYRKLRQWLGDNKIHELIFDERPYKKYKVKVNGQPNLKTICFDEDNQRIYKGEGTINFIAYFPFATNVFKFLTDEIISEYDNINEWLDSSGIVEQGDYDTFDITNKHYELYNPGDLETDFKLKFNFNENGKIAKTNISFNTENQFNFNEITKIGNDYGVQVNTENNLIEGIDENGKITGYIYNNYKESGIFFKIPLGKSTLSVIGATPASIEYNYLYF